MSPRYTHSFYIEPNPVSTLRIEDVRVDEEGRWVMEVSGDIQAAQALAEGLMRDGWRYEEGRWIEP